MAVSLLSLVVHINSESMDYQPDFSREWVSKNTCKSPYVEEASAGRSASRKWTGTVAADIFAPEGV